MAKSINRAGRTARLIWAMSPQPDTFLAFIDDLAANLDDPRLWVVDAA
jgi:hypothetical protein